MASDVNCPTVTSEEILNNVSKFVRGSTHEINISGEELVRAALFLLRTLPSSRQAVLEYLCSVYDEAVNDYIVKRDLVGPSALDAEESRLDPIIAEIQSLIISFIRTKPHAWAPVISSWAIDILGHISRKYSEHRSMLHASSLSELLLLWMTCSPTKSLIQIASECFTCLSGDASNRSVDCLLEASVRHSRHFDWVVGHIGSCFPKTIITRVLLCGMKDYYETMNGQSDIQHSADENAAKMASVVQILSHMAVQHGRDVQLAILNIFQESLQDGANEMQVNSPLYILYLASMSGPLMQAVVDDFLDHVTSDDLRKLVVQLQLRKPSYSKDVNSILQLIIHLLVKIGYRSNEIIQRLLNYSQNFPTPGGSPMENSIADDIKVFCSVVMNRLILELQRTANARPSELPPESHILYGLRSHQRFLSRLLHSSTNPVTTTWLVRLLSCLGLYSGEDCAADVLSDCLTSSQGHSNLSYFMLILHDVQSKFPEVVDTAMNKVVMKMMQDSNCLEMALGNLMQLCQFEMEEEAKNQSHLVLCPIIKPLSDHLSKLVIHLSNPEMKTAAKTMKLLMMLKIPHNLDIACLAKLCCSVIDHFFKCMLVAELQEKLEMCEFCIKFLSRLTEKVPIQSAILRYLIEGALSLEYSFLFGVGVGQNGHHTQRKSVKPDCTMLTENQRTVSSSTSLVFHAGVIGHGLKAPAKADFINKADEMLHRQMLLEALWVCSCPQKNGSTTADTRDGRMEERRPKTEAAKNLAMFLVELVSPDVMYNGILWPEEDFIRTTVERDLVIRRKFNENPVLWDIMDFLSSAPGTMRICSSLLRSVLATLMTQWESSREKMANKLPQQLELTQRVLELMRKGQLLPEPLCYTGDILEYLTPYEVYLLLLNIWRFMKENAPLQMSKFQSGCHPKYTDVIHSILHSNIDRLGHLYSLFFIVQTSSN